MQPESIIIFKNKRAQKGSLEDVTCHQNEEEVGFFYRAHIFVVQLPGLSTFFLLSFVFFLPTSGCDVIQT